MSTQIIHGGLVREFKMHDIIANETRARYDLRYADRQLMIEAPDRDTAIARLAMRLADHDKRWSDCKPWDKP